MVWPQFGNTEFHRTSILVSKSHKQIKLNNRYQKQFFRGKRGAFEPVAPYFCADFFVGYAAAYQNTTIFFLADLSYVGFVPVGDFWI